MKRPFDVTITREVSYTIYNIEANTPEEAESIAEDEVFDSNDIDFGDIISVDTVPSEDEQL